jgi:hypothetical protein
MKCDRVVVRRKNVRRQMKFEELENDENSGHANACSSNQKQQGESIQSAQVRRRDISINDLL